MTINRVKFPQQKIIDRFKEGGYEYHDTGSDEVGLTNIKSNDTFIIRLIWCKDAIFLIQNIHYTRKQNFKSVDELFLYVDKKIVYNKIKL